MKLLHDFTRLRASGRRLLSARRKAHERSYTVTVPAPLGRCASIGGAPAIELQAAATPCRQHLDGH